MYVDISRPPPPLPTPQLTEIAPGLSLLLPLSRRGYGPGLIIVVPDSEVSNLTIKDGVPSPLIKWAEEGYTVVEIREHALANKEVLKTAVNRIQKSEKCEPKDGVGLVVYNGRLWNKLAPSLSSVPEVLGVIIYVDSTELESLSPSAIPCLQHVAGKVSNPAQQQSGHVTVYEYPNSASSAFALPFQPDFSYTTEAVSHTRNLTFLKRRMNGPYFDLERVWEEHTYFEFENRSVEHTMSTMVQEPYVNHITTMTGGIGRERLTDFYRHHFIFKNPDSELELVSRTVGIDRIVDEFIFKFKHDSEVDWLIPGIPPTNKKLEIPMTAIVNIRGDRLYHEHISWDQGTVLVQLGLMPEYLPFPYPLPDGRMPSEGKRFEVRVPAAGIETATKMRDRNAVESNKMFEFGVREV